MSNIGSKIKGAVKAVVPPDSFFGIILVGLHMGDFKLIYHELVARKRTKAVMPLMDINVLNERIRHIKNLSSLKDARKEFYIIERFSPRAGLFAYVIAFFTQMVYALAKGMVPVIDMQNYPNLYLDGDQVGKVNAWEQYFVQPCGYGLDDIAGYKQVHDSGGDWQRVLPIYIYCEQASFNKHLELWGAIYENFFRLNDKVAQYIDEEYNRLIKPDMRVLGVFCRGTNYVVGRPKGHPAQPEVGDFIDKVRNVMPKWGCDYVYITSEDRKIVKRFEEAFPGKVLAVTQQYYDDLGIDFSQMYPAEFHFDRENDTFLKGLEYLSSVMVLSRCTSAVMGAASGSMAALFINGGKYENIYIYNLGVY